MHTHRKHAGQGALRHDGGRRRQRAQRDDVHPQGGLDGDAQQRARAQAERRDAC